jgi:uncharacterized RDD family membrane protein YckC
MTDQPPPPPPGGAYPPPPPPSGGYLPPPPGPVLRALPRQAYSPWLSRVAAYLIDHLPLALILGAGWLVGQNFVQGVCITAASNAVDQTCSVGYPPQALAVMSGAVLAGLAYFVWNYGYRQGTTGSSIGKSLLRLTVVSEKTGKPIGFGLSVLRQIAHLFDAGIFYIGYLLPLWDAKRQTLADKMIATVCLPLDRSATGTPE